MDITAETIQKILALAPANTHDLTDALGRNARFSDRQLFEVKAAPPATAPMVEVTTLSGFADLVRAKLEGVNFSDEYLIHIEDEHTVALVARASDEYGRRPTLIKATPVSFEGFRFDRWMPQEEFAIAVASMFDETLDKAYVLKLASTLTNEATTTTEDDGFTQRATAQAGLAHKERVEIKPRVSLAPFRTFPELPQPASEFVFRARVEGRTPELKLVEADGGRWKVEAISILHDAMKAFDLNIPIIA